MILTMESKLSLTQYIGIGGIVCGIGLLITGLLLLVGGFPPLPYELFGGMFSFLGSMMILIFWVTQFGSLADNPIRLNYANAQRSRT